MRTRQTSSIFWAAVSLDIISSTLVTKFMIHSGVLLSVTPFQPGPTSFSPVTLWQLWHFTSYIFLPPATIFSSNGCVSCTFWCGPMPLGLFASAVPVAALSEVAPVVLPLSELELHELAKKALLTSKATRKFFCFIIDGLNMKNSNVNVCFFEWNLICQPVIRFPT